MRYGIPKEALQQHIIVLGKTRKGKSSLMRSAFIEPLLENNKPVCIIDPKGDHWGLKLAADGQSPGYPVVIFGGDYADVPINEHSGASVAELVATGNRPCIIDLGGWMVGPRTRFYNQFAATLFKLNRGQRWLVIDEVHNFAPQAGTMKNPQRAEMIHWSNRLASEGLGRGINLIVASQRPQKVHKDLVTSMETLVAMAVIHPLDRKAIKDWIDGCGDPALGAKILGSLASFGKGEAYVWSPEIGYGPQHRQFKLFTTYDSFAPRKVKEKTLKGWASVDLEDVKTKLADAVKEAEAKDPTALRKKLIEANKRIQVLEQTSGPSKDVELELRADQEAMVAEGEALKTQCRNLEAALREAIARLRVLYEELSQAGEHLTLLSLPIEVPVVPKMADIPKSRPMSQPVAARSNVSPVVVALATKEFLAPLAEKERSKLSGPQCRIVDALAWLDSIGIAEPENAAVAFMASYKPNGGAYTNPRGSLVSAGLIEYPHPGRVKLTHAGRAIANFPANATGPELRERVLQRLSGPQQRILKPLLEAYPSRMSSGELAAAAGYDPNGGAFTNPRGALRTLGLIEYPSPGYVTARDILFPELTS